MLFVGLHVVPKVRRQDAYPVHHLALPVRGSPSGADHPSNTMQTYRGPPLYRGSFERQVTVISLELEAH